eukprot:Gb_02556 [translate_table: standard]
MAHSKVDSPVNRLHRDISEQFSSNIICRGANMEMADQTQTTSMNAVKQDQDDDQEQEQEEQQQQGHVQVQEVHVTTGNVKRRIREREKEKERTKLRERQRRAVTSRILSGLRQYGNYTLPVRADINDVIAALAREAGWTVEPDGTTYRSHSHGLVFNAMLKAVMLYYVMLGFLCGDCNDLMSVYDSNRIHKLCPFVYMIGPALLAAASECAMEQP